jgi:DNA-binding NtrC family response regulator
VDLAVVQAARPPPAPAFGLHGERSDKGERSGRKGFFAEADGGTLVLDEVGELPPAVQAKLLRALQEGEIQPVGAGRVEKVDVRVIACTNRDLAADVRAGRFREDLCYRLAVVELLVPPLSEHREEIPQLAAEFARRYALRFGVEGVRLSPALIESLRQADWPGNVRQLENAVARLVAMSSGGEIGPAGFRSAEPQPAVEAAPGPLTLREQVDAFERNLIAQARSAYGGNQSETARRLGLSRSALLDRLKKYGFGAAGE